MKMQNAAGCAALRGFSSVADDQIIPADAPTEHPVENLLSRLDRVRQTGPGRWIARCPSHDDKHPSLSIRETSDGTLLLKCWTGCGAADVVAAVGLDLKNLFPKRYERQSLRPRERWVPADVLRCLAKESLVIQIAAQAIASGAELTGSDLDRLADAAARFQAAAKEVGHG